MNRRTFLRRIGIAAAAAATVPFAAEHVQAAPPAPEQDTITAALMTMAAQGNVHYRDTPSIGRHFTAGAFPDFHPSSEVVSLPSGWSIAPLVHPTNPRPLIPGAPGSGISPYSIHAQPFDLGPAPTVSPAAAAAASGN
jgi:hypothetical protein